MQVSTVLRAVGNFAERTSVPKGPMGVHLILGANGRPNGEAFVEFTTEEVADAALTKDRATIGTRYVEVFRATPEQMTQARILLQPMHFAYVADEFPICI